MHVNFEAVFIRQGQARTHAVPGHPGTCHAITIILARETYMKCLVAGHHEFPHFLADGTEAHKAISAASMTSGVRKMTCRL